MLRLLPYENIALHSPLSAAQALSAISSAIEEPPQIEPSHFRAGKWGLGFRDGKFRGKVEGDRFTLKRDISYRNSFLPYVQGTIEPSDNGCIARVSLKMHAFVTGFLIVWLGAVLLAGAVMLAAYWRGRFDGGPLGAVFPFGMLAFGIALSLLGFKPEAAKAKDFLRGILHAQKAV